MNIEGTPWPTNIDLCGKGKGKRNALRTFEKTDYEMFYWDRLRTVSVAQFSITGINNKFINKSSVSNMLYNYGVVCFFIDDAVNELLCLPCQILVVGICGLPTRVKVYSPFINNYERILDVRKGDIFHVCYDTETKLTPKIFFVPWINEMSEISVTIRVNTFGLRAPVVAVSSIKEKLSMENMLQQYMDGKLFIELKNNEAKNKNGEEEEDLSKKIKILNLNPEYYIDKLESERNAIWNKIMETLGFKVNTAPFKKERAISSEVNANEEETISFYSARKNPRMEAVEWLHDIGLKNAKLVEVTKAEDVNLDSEVSDNVSNV